VEDEPQVGSSSAVGSIKKTTEEKTETGIRRKWMLAEVKGASRRETEAGWSVHLHLPPL